MADACVTSVQGLEELHELLIEVLNQRLGLVQFLGVPVGEIERLWFFDWGLLLRAARVLSVI
jgi:hypothetical protein